MWGIERPGSCLACDYWIGGFTLTLDKINKKDDCTYQVTLTMNDIF